LLQRWKNESQRRRDAKKLGREDEKMRKGQKAVGSWQKEKNDRAKERGNERTKMRISSFAKASEDTVRR